MKAIREFAVAYETNNLLFAPDEDQMLAEMSYLYDGKNKSGVHIERVNRIIEISDCVINTATTTAVAVVNVRFDAETRQFVAGDIIVGMALDKKSPVLLAHGAPGTVALESSDKLATLPEGTLINVKVKVANYHQMKPPVIIGEVFTRGIKGPKYKVMASKLDDEVLARYTKEITAEYKRRASIDAKKIDDTKKKFTGDNRDGKYVDILTAPKIVGMMVSRPPEMDRSSSLIMVEKASSEAVEAPEMMVLETFMREIWNYVRAINDAV